MSRFVKAVALWLIALAIPLQGMAAVVMPSCAPAHQAALDDGADHAAHGHVADRHDAATAGDDGGDPGHAGHSILKCCSAACALVAAMPASTVTRAQARSPAPLHPAARIYRSVTPDGLDRPPKTFLA